MCFCSFVCCAQRWLLIKKKYFSWTWHGALLFFIVYVSSLFLCIKGAPGNIGALKQSRQAESQTQFSVWAPVSLQFYGPGPNVQGKQCATVSEWAAAVTGGRPGAWMAAVSCVTASLTFSDKHSITLTKSSFCFIPTNQEMKTHLIWGSQTFLWQ